jgi:hypothetical protein
MARWRVDIIGKKLRHIGTIEAATETEAVETAIKELRIEPGHRSKVVVTKIEQRDR